MTLLVVLRVPGPLLSSAVSTTGSHPNLGKYFASFALLTAPMALDGGKWNVMYKTFFGVFGVVPSTLLLFPFTRSMDMRRGILGRRR